MRRRAVLLSWLYMAGAGCLDRGGPPVPPGSDWNTTPEYQGPPAEHEHRYSKDPPAEAIVEGGLSHESDVTHYATLLVEEGDTDRFDFEYIERQEDVDDDIATFVRETDFGDAVLLVVQVALPSGSMDLALEDVRWTATDDLHAYTRTPPIEGGDAEVLRATLYVRVSLGDAAAPERAVVTYENDPYEGGETTRFSTDH